MYSSMIKSAFSLSGIDYIKGWASLFEEYMVGSTVSVIDLKKRIGLIKDYDTPTAFYGAWLFYKLINMNLSYKCLRGMYYSGFISLFIPCLEESHLLIQDKRFGKNLAEHSLLTLLALDYVCKESMYCDIFEYTLYDPVPVLSFSSLLHDIGKAYDMEKHELIGAEKAEEYGNLFASIVGNDFLGEHLYLIILNHMRPLGYQRGEKWSDEAIRKFIDDCNGKGIALMTIVVSMADKYASTQTFSHLVLLYDLFDKVNSIDIS